MANLRDVRLRMRTVGQTLQVTKAMNLISTAKLRKGRRVLADTEPYFTRIQKSMFDILSGAGKVDSLFLRGPVAYKSSHTAIVAVTSDKGLAGGYNANIFNMVNNLCLKVKKPILILIGAVGNRYFTHTPYPILENFSYSSQMPTVENAGEIADYLISQFSFGVFNEIHIVYTHMYNTVKLIPNELQILPLNIDKIQDELSEMGNIKREKLQFEYLPSKVELFDMLVPLYVRGIIYSCMVESYASEQSARMVAMDEASKSADEMLAELRLNYNRTRQAGITMELTEIVSGSVIN